jgi:hypothetical protein
MRDAVRACEKCQLPIPNSKEVHLGVGGWALGVGLYFTSPLGLPGDTPIKLSLEFDRKSRSVVPRRDAS